MDSSTSASPVAAENAPSIPAGDPRKFPAAPLLWFSALLIILFFPVLQVMVTEWFIDDNMGHAIFVPFVAAYIAWLEQDKILSAPVKPYWPALALVLWGFCQMALGFLGADFFLARTAFLISLVGVIWTVAGTAVLRAMAFPLFLLLFMIRIPLFVYQQITFPLQLLASGLATRCLEFIGIPVMQNGNVLSLAGKDLEVVEACSGIRSLLSLTFLSVAYARLFETRLWVKIALFLSTVPIAIGCNAFRVTLTGIMTQYKPEFAEGVYHSLEGWVIFTLELVTFLGFHRLVVKLAGKPKV